MRTELTAIPATATIIERNNGRQGQKMKCINHLVRYVDRKPIAIAAMSTSVLLLLALFLFPVCFEPFLNNNVKITQ